MTLVSQASGSPARNAGPSLTKLFSTLPEERRLRKPADVLVIIGRQLELVVQDQGLEADVAIGTLRFSLFRLHQGRIAQLAPHCRSITVFGEADVEPPTMPGVEFVALQPGSALSQEWFLLIDSPSFWGGLITQAVPERTGGNMRRYMFHGILTADERMVNRAWLLLSLASRRPAPQIGARYPLANRANWAQVVYHLVTHSEAQRLDLSTVLAELPELVELAAFRDRSVDDLLYAAITALAHHIGALGQLLFRCEGENLNPAAWGAGPRPTPQSRRTGLAAQALNRNEPIMHTLSSADPEQALFPDAASVVAVPLLIHERPWGLLMVGLAEAEPGDSAGAATIVGVAALLEQLLSAQNPPIQQASPRPGNVAPPAAPFAAAAPLPTAPARPAPSLASAPPRPMALPSFGPPAAPAPASAPAQNTNGTAESAAFGLPSWMRSNAGPPPRSLAPATQALAVSAASSAEGNHDRTWPNLQKRLMGALIAFDQRSADYVWSDACTVYPTEAICTELLMPVQIAVGEGWHRGEVSVAAEHFCSRYVEGKLLNLLNGYNEYAGGPLAVIGCAQNEMHELGAIMLSLFMRWAGFRVIYLGQNVPNSTIDETIRQLRPQILGLSATTIEAAHNLTEVGQMISRIEQPRPQFIFGGMAFYERPDLRARIQGQFLEGDVRKIVRDMAAQLKK